MTPEIITKQFKRGMTVEQIAAFYETEEAYIQNIIQATRETAVSIEGDGFGSNYTIEALVKEEPEMTEAIAEVKKDAQEAVPAPVETTEGTNTWELLEEAQRKENAKWIHFIASQMQNAVITSSLDVEDRNGQLVKVEKVTFTRVQTL